MCQKVLEGLIKVLNGEEIKRENNNITIKDEVLYFDKNGEQAEVDLYSTPDDEIVSLIYVLANHAIKLLEDRYLNKEVKLFNLDNDMCTNYDFSQNSIFDNNVQECLEDGFSWGLGEQELGANFEFEIIEKTKDIEDMIIKVVDIDLFDNL